MIQGKSYDPNGPCSKDIRDLTESDLQSGKVIVLGAGSLRPAANALPTGVRVVVVDEPLPDLSAFNKAIEFKEPPLLKGLDNLPYGPKRHKRWSHPR